MLYLLGKLHKSCEWMGTCNIQCQKWREG